MDYTALKPVRLDKLYAIGETIPDTALEPTMVKRLMSWGKITPVVGAQAGTDEEVQKALEELAKEKAELDKAKKALATETTKQKKAKEAADKAIEAGKAEAEAMKAEAEKLMAEAEALMAKAEASTEGDKTGAGEGEQTALPDTPPDGENSEGEPPADE